MEKKKKKTLPYLHEDLITKILLRLPVKSLIRFKRVCKLWLTLISDPQFANSHFEITAAIHSRRILFISKLAPETRTRSIDFEASLCPTSASLDLNFLLPEKFLDLEIKGSCRGFVVLHCSSEIHIWNPSTRVHKQIPLSPNDSDLDDKYFCYLYGFGYDQSTNDYLVVSMSYDTTLALSDISSNLEFFSLRENTWKEIEGTHFPYMSSFAGPIVGSLFKEVIHWLAFQVDILMDVIVAFDLTERKLLEMHLPDKFNGELEYFGLWVYVECLSLWAMDYDNNTFEIWVMKEYKVHSSWTKTCVVSLDGIPTNSPLCSTKSGDIIGTYESADLIKYNDKGQMLQVYCNAPDKYQMALYVESLLSLPTDNEQA